mmetsp:Transcript_4497/g.16441  ORF Transcript_4497/g.16441 Transcript_4497/m.16441 type:complete len:1060 (-) Transcript_4497:26-3205(-)
MGLLKKSSKKASSDEPKNKIDKHDEANDPLGLGRNDSPASGSSRGKEKTNAREGMENQENNRIERKTEKHAKKIKAEAETIIAAIVSLAQVAGNVRGIFEEVRPVEQAAEVLKHFESDGHAPGMPPQDPHAIASLIVYFLRDKEEAVCTSMLRDEIMDACSLSDDKERHERLRSITHALPAENLSFLRSLRELVLAVSVEHEAFYQDGLETRIDALAQLFGPLLIRPAASEMKRKAHLTSLFARHLFAKTSILVPSPVAPPPAAAEDKEEAQDAQQGSGRKPAIPKISIPSAMTARALTFRNVLEKAGGMQTAREGLAKKEGEEGDGKGSSKLKGGASKNDAEPDRRKNATIRFAEEDEDSDETNYNQASTPLDSTWKRHVQSLTDEERRECMAGAMQGGPLLKYSSRGRPVQLMFFKMSSSADSLSWGPVASPDDRKYFLSLLNVQLVLPGDLAVGEFAHAGEESQRHLRLALELKGKQRLELEALNAPALRMWGVAIQHAILTRTFFSEETPGESAALPFTARDWQRPETGDSEQGRSTNLSLPLRPAASHGLATARLLEGVGDEQEAAGRSGATTSRPVRSTSFAPVPAGPATARGPGGRDAPDLSMLNVHVLLSKARHNRREDVVALLDKGVPVDAEDEEGNTVLIVACQNNHKRIVKEALRRRCDVNHQNRRGDTCLHFCFALKYFSLGHYLLSKGADPSIRNKLQQTCFDRCAPESFDLPPPDAPDAGEDEGKRASGRARKRREEEPKLSSFEQEMRELKARMEALEKENSLLRSRTDQETKSSVPSSSVGGEEEKKRREEELSSLAELVTPESRGKYQSPSLSEPASTVQVGGKYERSIASSYDPSRAQQVAEHATGLGEMESNLNEVHAAIHDVEEVLSKVTSPFAVRERERLEGLEAKYMQQQQQQLEEEEEEEEEEKENTQRVKEEVPSTQYTRRGGGGKEDNEFHNLMDVKEQSTAQRSLSVSEDATSSDEDELVVLDVACDQPAARAELEAPRELEEAKSGTAGLEEAAEKPTPARRLKTSMRVKAGTGAASRKTPTLKYPTRETRR